ncbi:NUDIX hydrolase [Robertkochia flava]|uniref:NUDIX hydrolase n=1 Tax=Robertkochia flava TaxID=3447986 RepID=UPI001CCB24B0|nr:NUDIX domain-containing protein [Robertkochia marina]
MDEWVDIWTDDGKPTGRSILKSEAHRKGVFHPTVHLWIYNSLKQVLFQKRACSKMTFPGKWDVSVAGHITSGDDAPETAVREAREELGLSLKSTDLKWIGMHPSKTVHAEDVIDNEFHHIYCIECDFSEKDLALQKEEVEEACWFPFSTLEAMQDPDHFDEVFVPFDPAYLKLVIHHLTSIFQKKTP